MILGGIKDENAQTMVYEILNLFQLKHRKIIMYWRKKQ